MPYLRFQLLPRLTLLLFASLLLGACSSSVETTVTRFNQLDDRPRGSIAVQAAERQLQDSLEFDYHQGLLEHYLMREGYRIVSSSANPDYIAFLSYGIDSGTTEVSSRPVMGHRMSVGFGVADVDDDGNVFYGSYLMPSYGVVGNTTSTQTLYTSAIALDIVARDQLDDETPRPVFEGRAQSRGLCSSITPIFDPMLQALFEQFPGVSGQTLTIKVETEDSGC